MANFRDTTREEDKAYSLMGLLDIRMVPIYGEGRKDAFFGSMMGLIKLRRVSTVLLAFSPSSIEPSTQENSYLEDDK